MAPSTPPPPSIRSFAALTIASTSIVVMSARITSIGIRSEIVDLNWRQRISGPEPEDRSVKVQLGFETPHDRLRLPEPVLLALERQMRDRQSLRAGSVRHHRGLIRRHDAVLESLKQDDRAGQPIDEVNRRAGAILLARLGIRTDEAIQVSRLELVRVAGKHLDVTDAVIARSGVEDPGLKRERRQRRVAAGAAAANNQARCIGQSGPDEMLRRPRHVLDVGDSPLPAQGIAILAAEP